ncbi:MAG: hypothetical protein JW909_11765 [Planctomycetes bacterium]|nr:hypothetical protein [Planctomycetota bacterium]
MKKCLPCFLVAGLLAAGCGDEKIYSSPVVTAERRPDKRVKLAELFDKKARTFEMKEDAQERNAPYGPGYNVRGETAPLTGIDPVVDNISKDWVDVVDIMEGEEPYDYEILADIGLKLIMRADELRRGRIIELENARVKPEQHKEDETDRAIMRFGVLAKRFMTAAATRRRDDLVEVYTVFPHSTPFIRPLPTSD